MSSKGDFLFIIELLKFCPLISIPFSNPIAWKAILCNEWDSKLALMIEKIHHHIHIATGLQTENVDKPHNTTYRKENIKHQNFELWTSVRTHFMFICYLEFECYESRGSIFRARFNLNKFYVSVLFRCRFFGWIGFNEK